MSEILAEMSQRVNAVTDSLWPILHGQGERVQALALANCVALWIAAHVDAQELGKPAGQRPLTDRYHAEELAAFVALVRLLLSEWADVTMEFIDTVGNA